jgi:DNA mismatch repair protein MutL
LLAAPERARAGSSGLSLLVNGRPVRDRALARAVSNAYGSVLDGGRYPVGVVWLELPHELVDINVHPQKAEVRFTDARGIFDAVTREIHAGLAHAFHLPDVAHPFAQSFAQSRDVIPAPTAIFPTTTPTFTPTPANLVPATNLFVADSTASIPWTGPGRFATLRFIGQAKGTFLVCEGDDGLYILDQHAAAERVAFDRLRRSFANKAIAMQRLLVPEVVELPASSVAMLEEQAAEVAALGVEVRAVGDDAVAVHAIPAILARAKPSEIVRNLAGELSRSAGRAFGGAVDLVLATMACHGSIRAGDAISGEEVRALLVALDRADFAGHCPHGRPVVMRLGFGELERRVGR